MTQAVGEQTEARGRYRASCIGPATLEEGEEIVAYVRDHPELLDDETGRAKRAELRGWRAVPSENDKAGWFWLLPNGSTRVSTTADLDLPDGDRFFYGRCPGYSPNVEAARILGIPLREKWTAEEVENVVCTEGKDVMLDAALAGSAYTVVGPYLGLISSVSYTAVAAGDTGVQINGTNGWKEAGGANAPTYTGNRKTAVWSSAGSGSKALSSALAFAITGTGTVKGAFLLYFTNAVNTKDDAHGSLYSAGLFGTGDRAVLSGDTLNVSYSTSL